MNTIKLTKAQRLALADLAAGNMYGVIGGARFATGHKLFAAGLFVWDHQPPVSSAPGAIRPHRPVLTWAGWAAFYASK